MPFSKPGFDWIARMAWRDSRRSRGRLLLFVSAIIIGIAALTAINTFGENLRRDIDREAKKLLGADLSLETNQLPSDTLQQLIDTLGSERSKTVSFVSMVYFPKQQGTRLAYVRALEGRYPLYGELGVDPPETPRDLSKGVLVEEGLMQQFGVSAGDSIKVGEVVFPIAGALTSAPGRAGITASIAPVVFIPIRQLEATGLVQRGSRIEYAYFFKLRPGQAPEAFLDDHEKLLSDERVDGDTVADRKRTANRSFENMNSFLQLVAFVALILGCIGVASAVHLYTRSKTASVALLRCLGASGSQAFQIFLLQMAVAGALGSLMGVVAGSLLQYILPVVFGDFLPIEGVSTALSWSAIAQGLTTGILVSVVFALWPLLRIRRISPLQALRADFEPNGGRDPLRLAALGLILALVFTLTWIQTRNWLEALVFLLGLALALGILGLIASLLRWSVKRFFPRNWSFVWRQALANLNRPHNQTFTLMVVIGLGAALLSTLFFTRDLLLDQVRITGSGDRPNTILFDIQTPQKEAVAQLTRDNGMPLIQQVPIVTMRLESIDGATKYENEQDSTGRIRRWVFNHEYRVTYRDTLIDSEKIIEGVWHGDKPKSDTIFVSLAKNVAEDMGAHPGARLVFDVQGRMLETVVSSIREVDFNRVQTNFLVVFPTGILEHAPQFHVIVTRSDSLAQAVRFQRAMVRAFPNVSIIDLTQILKTVDDILGKVSFVIQFMALFSIITGITVLVSAVWLSRYQRMRESALLRTLGAKRRQLNRINGLEYAVLGGLGALTGVLLSIAAAWAIARFQLDIPFRPRFLPPLLAMVSIAALTVIAGLLTSRGVVRRPPLEVLRMDLE